ncbi:MAG: hypothetical protein SF123_21530 [Chloroflexota bacterium]|nr:hypothetical protein [Chloroflexota bacterium]
MDRLAFFDLLELPSRAVLLKAIEWDYWQQRVHLTFLYNPDAPQDIHVTLLGCTQFRVDILSDTFEDDSREHVSDVIAVLVGDPSRHEPFLMTTTTSETAIHYREIRHTA